MHFQKLSIQFPIATKSRQVEQKITTQSPDIDVGVLSKEFELELAVIDKLKQKYHYEILHTYPEKITIPRVMIYPIKISNGI